MSVFLELQIKLLEKERVELREEIIKLKLDKEALTKQLTLTDVSSMFSAKQMEKAYNDGVEAEQQRCGDFDIENYR